MKDPIIKDPDLRVTDRESQRLLRKDAFGQVVFLTGAEFLKGESFVLSFGTLP